MPSIAKAKTAKDSTANLGFGAKLWLAADKLRNYIDAADWSGAAKTAAGSPKGERVCIYQFYATSTPTPPAANRQMLNTEIKETSYS